MGSKLYVGNLSYNTTGSDLEQLCGQHGTVQSAEVIQDRDSGRSKGFGFVQMGSDEEAQAVIAALNGQEVDGRALTVNEAKPREDRPRGGGGGFGGGRGGGGGGGRRSDIASKHDIVLLGHLANGLGYYRFSYLGSSKPYVGVIAQEVQNVAPHAVTRGQDGYLRVRYEQLGLTFRSYGDWLARGARIPTALEATP